MSRQWRGYRAGAKGESTQRAGICHDNDSKMSSEDIDQKDLAYLESLSLKTHNQLETDGWTAIVPVSSSTTYSVYTRADKLNKTLAQFLVIATMKEVSPRIALLTNVNSEYRRKFDLGIKDIYTLPIKSPLSASSSSSVPADISKRVTQDHQLSNSCRVGFNEILYYRSKCPWPMKDREYVMSRRCRVLENRGAALIVSKAETDNRVGPVPVGVQRMENYRSISAFLSNNRSTEGNSLDRLGTVYVTISTDEQVATSASALRLINAVAGRMIADYMTKMSTVSMSLQKSLLS